MSKQSKKVFESKLSTSDRVASTVAKFTGNMHFVWWHALLFIFWIGLNTVAGEFSWDPYPFNFLTMVVSLEAIFLSTFVLIAQNQESKRNEIREQLDYEVNVKAEKEVQEIKKAIARIEKKLK